MKKIDIVENYRKDENLISEFHNFISVVFPSISFREWNKKGFWTENYIPFSIIDSGKIISNLCVSEMAVIVNEKKLKAIQIGAVGTLPEYRNRGLSRYLMNYVMDKYKDEIDLYFLFANETVMEFYPKFGFRNIEEIVFLLETNIPTPNYSARKLDLSNESDYKLLLDLLENRHIITNRFGAEHYEFITMWHILNLYKNDLYFIEEDEVLFIKTEEDNVLHIMDVIHKEEFDFQLVLPKVIESDSIKRIKYYFPADQLNFKFDRTISENCGLFIRGNFEIANKPIKFPETAHT